MTKSYIPTRMHFGKENNNKELEANIQAMYLDVHSSIKEDIVEAASWARLMLTNHEGSGHGIEVLGDKSGFVVCAFAKPSWAGDHCGRAMETGSEAIVMAVCEYLCGA